jgi:hypothetical protein
MFGNAAATSLTVTPDRLTAISPGHLAGTVSLTVTTPDGQASASFTYLPRPELPDVVIAAPAASSRVLPPPVPGSSPTGKHPLTASQIAPNASAMDAGMMTLLRSIMSVVDDWIRRVPR